MYKPNTHSSSSQERNKARVNTFRTMRDKMGRDTVGVFKRVEDRGSPPLGTYLPVSAPHFLFFPYPTSLLPSLS